MSSPPEETNRELAYPSIGGIITRILSEQINVKNSLYAEPPKTKGGFCVFFDSSPTPPPRTMSRRPEFSISIVNLSTFSVYISAIGFCGCKYGNNPHPVPEPLLERPQEGTSRRIFPLKLDSRQAVMFNLSDGNEIEASRDRRYMYAETSSGEIEVQRIPYPDAVFNHPRQAYIQ